MVVLYDVQLRFLSWKIILILYINMLHCVTNEKVSELWCFNHNIRYIALQLYLYQSITCVQYTVILPQNILKKTQRV